MGKGEQPGGRTDESDLLAYIRSCRVHFVTYGDDNFKSSRARIVTEAGTTGWFVTRRYYTPDDIGDLFREHGHFIKNHERGGGFWIWKPYIILARLTEHDVQPGEYIVYADAGCSISPASIECFAANMKLLSSSRSDFLRWSAGLPERHWTKKDLLHCFGANPEHPHPDQLLSGLIVLRKTKQSIRAVAEWYRIAISDNYHLIDDSPSMAEEDPEFRQHRHDQSIFSLIGKRDGHLVSHFEKPFLITRIRI